MQMGGKPFRRSKVGWFYKSGSIKRETEQDSGILVRDGADPGR